MGFLESGVPLSWSTSLPHIEYVRKHGIEQFINIFMRVKGRTNDVLKWGDEIEYHLVEVPPVLALGDVETRSPRLALIAPELLKKLESEDARVTFPIPSAWRPEFGSWMIEATPGVPYGGDMDDLASVERNMAMRRWRISVAAPTGVVPFSIPCFPLLGVSSFSTSPQSPVGGPYSKSSFLSDAVLSPHPRFGALAANIRRRRGGKVDIRVPVFLDTATPSGPLSITTITESPLSEEAMMAATAWLSSIPSSTEATLCAGEASGWKSAHSVVEKGGGGEGVGAPSHPPKVLDVTLSPKSSFYGEAGGPERDKALPPIEPISSSRPEVHMDAMAFGMGCCCLQVTFQARDIRESRVLYDQLAPWTPLLLALTANTPIFRGHLVSTDTRWDVISASVDCRTPVERGVAGEVEVAWQSSPEAHRAAGAGGRLPIRKSRYSSIDTYISESERLVDAYHNDLSLECDGEALVRLEAVPGLDARLARHVAHLFVRDPLVVFAGRLSEVNDELSGEHFENLQSTNWRSMRWKPPPVDSLIGWRVELRSMEVQCTDFENAAFTVFAVLLSRVILFFDLNFYMPLSLVDENFCRANTMGSAVNGTFWFPRHCIPCGVGGAASPTGSGDWGAIASAAAGVGASSSCSSASATPTSPSPFPTSPPKPPAELTLAQILLGDGSDEYPGMIPLIFAYLDLNGCGKSTLELVATYLQFIANRATGAALTGAAWQREFVKSHPSYKGDSIVPPGVVTDLLRAIQEFGKGNEEGSFSPLTGPLRSPPSTSSTSIGEGRSSVKAGDSAPTTLPETKGVADPSTPTTDSVRMRGSSFFREITDKTKSKCQALRSLLQCHRQGGALSEVEPLFEESM